MPNQQIIDYLNQNKNQFSKDALLGELKKAGFSDEEIGEAVNIVFSNAPKSNMESGQSTANIDPKSFKLYRGRAPLLLQIIAGLMWLGGLGMILQGIPLLLILGLGIIPIVLGIFNIKYAKAVFKMERKGYRGTLVLQGIAIIVFLLLWANEGFMKIDAETISILLYALIVALTLFLYRKKFVY